MSAVRDRLRRGFPVAAWGMAILVLSIVALAFQPDTVTTVLGFGTAAGVVATGLTIFTARRLPEPGTPRPHDAAPELSLPTVLLAVGVTVAIVGAEAGAWLIGVGGGLAVAGVGGVTRELRAQRHARRRAT